jgi:hypothetical protein
MHTAMVVRFLAVSLLVLPACARRELTWPDAAVESDHDAGHTVHRDAGHPAHDAGHMQVQDDAGQPLRDAGMPTDAGMHEATDAGSDASFDNAVKPSTAVGGTGGGAFDDTSMLPPLPEVKSITLSGGDRLDRVELALRSGSVFIHGGSGGKAMTLELMQGEALINAHVCTGEFDSTTRIFFLRVGTSQSRTLQAGKETSACSDFAAPDGHQISGLFGRSGEGVDQLGLLYTRLVEP